MKRFKIKAKVMGSIVEFDVEESFRLYINQIRTTIQIEYVASNGDVAFKQIAKGHRTTKHFTCGHTLLFRYYRYRVPYYTREPENY